PPVGQGNPGRRTDVIMQGYPPPHSYNRFLTFPVVDRDRVYVQGPYGSAALNAADGKPAWHDGERGGEEGAAPVRSFRGSYYRNRNLPQGAPALDDGILALRAAPFGGGFGTGYVLSVRDARSGKELWRR